jgi:hypothetical protein
MRRPRRIARHMRVEPPGENCPAPKGRPSPAQASGLGQPRASSDLEPCKGEIPSARSVPDIALIKFNPVALQVTAGTPPERSRPGGVFPVAQCTLPPAPHPPGSPSHRIAACRFTYLAPSGLAVWNGFGLLTQAVGLGWARSPLWGSKVKTTVAGGADIVLKL